MKISRLFHWLYAILMLLPIIPVVGVGLYYAFNKNAVIPQVEKYNEMEVDFNQKFSNVYDFDLPFEFSGSLDDSRFNTYFGRLNLTADHKYFNRLSLLSSNSDFSLYIHAVSWELSESYVNINTNSSLGFISSSIFTSDVDKTLTYTIDTSINVTGNYFVKFYFCSFDLTQMFGVGNEPSVQEFNMMFTENYYDYTSSKHIVIDYDTIQVADDLSNHFWLPSFGGLGWTVKSVFSYLIGTLFGFSVVSGSIGYVVLSLMTYWSCISLIWLAYDILMYLFLLIHRYLDKGVLD